ncbi:MAG: hypothetical protein KC656_18375, partial [Myxococcales bacterium]|nr:hypothetical protein [Myxococcales bacterium]
PCELRTDSEEGILDDQDGDDLPDAYDCDNSGPEGDSDFDRIPNFLEEVAPNNTLSFCKQNEDFRQMGTVWPVTDCGDQVQRLQNTSCSISPDSDCDGVLDCEEAGFLDEQGNPDPTPCDGPPLTQANWTTYLPQLRDTDGDQVPDMFDRDDDNDGIPTREELMFTEVDLTTAQLTTVCTGIDEHVGPDTLGFLLTATSDFDGWRWFCVTAQNAPTNQRVGDPGNEPWSKNTDAPTRSAIVSPDEIPDYIDKDDDGDSTELDADGGNRSTALEGRGDMDGDGVPNWLDPYDFDGVLADADNDGIPNGDEMAAGLDPYSDDSDHDGIPDNLELFGDPSVVCGPGGTTVTIGSLEMLDCDGDGIPDATDPDDDNDGIPSSEEGLGDQDRDGIPNFRDTDSDNDGTPDADEVAADGSFIDSDCDGLVDQLDATDESAVFGTWPDCSLADTGTPPVEEGCGGCNSSGPTGFFGIAGFLAMAVFRRRQS